MSKGGGSSTATSTSRVLPEYEKFANETLALAGTQANTAYMPYLGERLANVSGDEQAAFDQIRRMGQAGGSATRGLGHGVASQVAGTQAPTMSAGQVTGTAQQFMNPYQQNVVDTTMSELQRQNQMALNQVGQSAVGAGAFGGSRHGVAQGETNRGFADVAARTAAQLNQGGYNASMDNAMTVERANLGSQDANLNRQLQASNQMLDSGMARMERDMAYAGALGGSGSAQRDAEQARLDLRLGDFYEQQNHPLQQLGVRQSALGMTPMGSVQKTPVQRSGLNFGQLLGGLGSLAGGLGGSAGLLAGLCWVAREAYGIENPRWLIFREWMVTESPRWLFKLYSAHGEGFAKWIADKPRVKSMVRAAMDVVVDRKIREAQDVASFA